MGESGPCGLPLVQWQAVSCVGERWRACGKWVSHLGPGRALLLCPFSHLPTVLPQLPCWTTEKLLSPTHPLLSLSLSFSSSITLFFTLFFSYLIILSLLPLTHSSTLRHTHTHTTPRGQEMAGGENRGWRHRDEASLHVEQTTTQNTFHHAARVSEVRYKNYRRGLRA